MLKKPEQQKKPIKEFEEAKRVKKRCLIYTTISASILTFGRFIPEMRYSFDSCRYNTNSKIQERLLTAGVSDRGDYQYVYRLEEQMKAKALKGQNFDLQTALAREKKQIVDQYNSKHPEPKHLHPVIEFTDKILNPTSPFLHALEHKESSDQQHKFEQNRLPEVFVQSLKLEYQKLEKLEQKLAKLEENHNLSLQELANKKEEIKGQLRELYLSGRYNRVNKILPLIVKDGYEPDSAESLGLKVVDFLLSSVEFVTKASKNLLTDELVLEILLIYTIFLLNVCSFSKLHLTHKLFGALFDKASVTSWFFNTLSQTTVKLENLGLNLRARVEAAKFSPEVEKGTVLKTLLANKEWKDKVEIIRQYLATFGFEIDTTQTLSSPKGKLRELNGQEKLVKIWAESLLEVQYLFENLFPKAREVEYKNKQVIEGIFEEIRTIRNWILYFKLSLQLPLLIKMSGSLHYAIWDNMIDMVGMTDGLIIKSKRDYTLLSEELMGEFGFKIDTDTRAFKERLSRFNKTLTRCEAAGKRIGNKVGNKETFDDLSKYLLSLSINLNNLKNQRENFDLESLKEHLQTMFIASSSQFFGMEMAEVIAQDLERIGRISEKYGLEFIVKCFILYTVLKEQLKVSTIRQEELEFDVIDENNAFKGFLGIGKEKVSLRKEIVANWQYDRIFNLILEPINESLQALKENSLILETFLADSSCQSYSDLRQSTLRTLKTLEIKLNVDNPLYPLEQELASKQQKISWIENRLEEIRVKSESNRGCDKTEAINKLFWLQKVLTDNYNPELGSTFQVDTDQFPAFVSEQERSDRVELAKRIRKHISMLTQTWQKHITGSGGLDSLASNWLSLADGILEDIRQLAPVLFNRESEAEFATFDHYLEEQDLSVMQRIFRAKAYFQTVIDGTDLNGVKYKDAQEYRFSRIKRRLLSVIASLNSLAEMVDKKSLERIIEISLEYEVFAEDLSPHSTTDYKKTKVHILKKDENNQIIQNFNQIDNPNFKDNNGNLIPILAELDRQNLGPHLFNFGTFVDSNNISRKSGLSKHGKDWITNHKYTSKPLAEKHFGNLLDTGFINFLTHISLEQEKDEWIGSVRQERYTFFERLMHYTDTQEFKELYKTVDKNNQTSQQIKRFLLRLLQFLPASPTAYKKYQPEPKL
ncbi:MAG: hypothetical protein KME30_26155 [Iphinoe sp. HA4291-MV1]|jgi:hypothetical protein|nr:hypothetical protein [Iphinoe sp. HA4291-MV1]